MLITKTKNQKKKKERIKKEKGPPKKIPWVKLRFPLPFQQLYKYTMGKTFALFYISWVLVKKDQISFQDVYS